MTFPIIVASCNSDGENQENGGEKKMREVEKLTIRGRRRTKKADRRKEEPRTESRKESTIRG